MVDPRVRVGLGVAARQPADELAVVDQKVDEGELVRVEDEGRDDQGDDGEPKVDQVRDPDGHGRKEQDQEAAGARVDARP